MADYNPNYMAAYKQYGQSLQQVGARNLSGAGTSAMKAYQDSVDQQGQEGKTAGLGAPTTKAKEEQKTSFWDRITDLFTSNDVDVTSVYTPSINPASLYDSDAFKAPEVKDYVYRAEMSELTQDMVEQAMGYEKPQLGQLQLLDTRAMTEEEKKRLGPLLKLADDIRNENITTTELPPIEGEEQSSLMDALMEGQPTAGLMSRPSSFTGGSVQVASNIPNWMQDMSAAELTDALVGIKEGTVDPDTGQPIQSAEDVSRETVEEFNARRRRERGLPDVAPEVDTAPPVQETLEFKFEDTSKRLVNDLKKDFGLTTIQAAAIAGNLATETDSFKTLQEYKPVVEGSRGGYGFAQWTAGRRVAYENWAKENGVNPASYEANYGYLKEELSNRQKGTIENIGVNTIKRLKKINDINEAAKFVQEYYLRPGVPHTAKRQRFSRQILGYFD